ncbi:hypothetical protein IQ13_2340 [Lacibacter cauensis]|uniref:Uncharacterized protein n=1 Tax=Lacibacter cauensis TaxID=510947 RepID=A0A562SJP6_9BACT|nr:hypothetical protein [Lacibacter cauensis]TWI81323.1 hypothetical protein IQ13_2340 [Lacibacter cauensis]
MTRSTDIVKELEALSPVVAQINAVVPYQVPEVYFETLSTVVMARIAAGGNEENSLLQIAGKVMPQDVPAGYFNSLADTILTKLKANGNNVAVTDELQELSPVLAGISKANVYEAPAGYFDTLTTAVTAKLQPETKVVSLSVARKWMRYAAAAVVLSMLAFGINYSLQKKNNAVAVAAKIKTEAQFNQQLASVSDDAIINYLQLTADTKDVESIKQLIDGNQLPEEADYIDEEFLDAFMKELEAKQTN